MNRHDEKSFYSPDVKLADMIESDVSLLNVLSRMGISLGFGDDTMDEVCRRYGVDTRTFLLICNVYSFPGYMPSEDMLRSGSVRDIVRYLHNSHSFYLENDMEMLEASITKLTAPCASGLRKVIHKFFSDYEEEVRKHFAYEENVVFPYVLSLVEEGGSGTGYSIGQFEKNHSNIDEKLNDLKNIVMKYLPDCCEAFLRNNVLYHLFLLEKDLDKHTFIENNVLIPMANRRETYGKE